MSCCLSVNCFNKDKTEKMKTVYKFKIIMGILDVDSDRAMRYSKQKSMHKKLRLGKPSLGGGGSVAFFGRTYFSIFLINTCYLKILNPRIIYVKGQTISVV